MVERLAIGAYDRCQGMVLDMLLNSAGANRTAQAQPIRLGDIISCYPDSLVFTHRLFSVIGFRKRSFARMFHVINLFYHELEAQLGQGNSYASTFVICRSQQKKPLLRARGSRTMAMCHF